MKIYTSYDGGFTDFHQLRFGMRDNIGRYAIECVRSGREMYQVFQYGKMLVEIYTAEGDAVRFVATGELPE